MASFFTKDHSESFSSTTPKAVPWVEKYRPTKLDDISSQDHAVLVLKRTLESSNLPHMLFYGPPGTGKTSTILALAKQLYGPELMRSRVLELNASDERGIAIVREKVKNFARTTVSNPSAASKKQYPCPPYKLIILDEADSMTQDAQAALRRTMETYSRITRFCLICNYVTRIIEPLASRCSKFRFRSLDSIDAISRIKYICDSEQLTYEDGVLESVLKAGDGDLRKAITLLQSAAKLRPPTSEETDGLNADNAKIVTVKIIEDVSGRIPDSTIQSLTSLCQSNLKNSEHFTALQNAIESTILDGWSSAQLLSQIHDEIVLNELIRGDLKNKIVLDISDADKRLIDGADEHLTIFDLLVKLSKILERT
ncbi:P-loop containing nucleoside triphosphate hydrolase protein [Lipomyces japonicus]|uniref:P-loop containing nucleoside triphosphate hydrolase protein n=1 Tax=Lipomyces japonicus TaxID=56871 RepID=UPI0034CFF3BD